MKTIASLGLEESLRAMNDVAEDVENYLQTTGIMEIRKRMPAFTGNENPALRQVMLDEQAKKNMREIRKAVLKDHAKQTAEIVKKLCVPEEGESVERMTGADVVKIIMEVFADRKTMDFFVSLVRLGLTVSNV